MKTNKIQKSDDFCPSNSHELEVKEEIERLENLDYGELDIEFIKELSKQEQKIIAQAIKLAELKAIQQTQKQATAEIDKLKARIKVLETFDTDIITKAREQGKEQATADFMKKIDDLIYNPKLDRKRTEEVYLFLDLIKKSLEDK